MSDRRSDPERSEAATHPEGNEPRALTRSQPDPGSRLGPPVPEPREGLDMGLPASFNPEPKPLSPWVRPLLWVHRLVGGDKAQHKQWKKRIVAIRQAADIDREPSTEGKEILADVRAWRQMKITGVIGASGGLGLGAVWMSWLIPTYAVGHGFGWLAALYLLPVPFAWKFGRRLWERASLQGMKDLGRHPTPQQQLRTLSAGMLRGMAAGAGMGFSLVFLQGLISWLMTPAPTIFHELIIDLVHGSMGAALGATVGAVFGPLVGRAAPDATPSSGGNFLPEPETE